MNQIPKVNIFKLIVILMSVSCISQSEKLNERELAADSQSESQVVQFLDEQLDENASFDLEGEDSIFLETFQETVEVTYKEDEQYLYYTAAPGETLMLLAFKFYSDHLQWKNILRNNIDSLQGQTQITQFIELRLPKPLKRFREPKGMPYLIKPGDSLSLISRKVYGEMRWWQQIWKNNQEMISDPNLIFAGFTLFYTDKDREAPSQDYRLF